MSWTRPLTTNLGAWYKCGGLAEELHGSVNTAVEDPNRGSIAIGVTSNGSTETRFDSYWDWGNPVAPGRPGSLKITLGAAGDENIYANTGFTFCAFVRGWNDAAISDPRDVFLLSGAGSQHPVFFKENNGFGLWTVAQDCNGVGFHTLSGNAVANPYGSNLGGTPGTSYGLHNVTPNGTNFIGSEEGAGNYDTPWDHIAFTMKTVTVCVDPSDPLLLDWPGGEGLPTATAVRYDIYRNGTLVSTNFLLTQCEVYTLDETEWYLNGGFHSGGHEHAFRNMADVGIWRRDLTAFEILSIATDGIETSSANSAGAGVAFVAAAAAAAEWVDDASIGDGSIIDAANLMCTSPEPHKVNSASVLTINNIISQWAATLADDNIFTKTGEDGSDTELIDSAKASFKRSINNIAHHHAVFTHVVAGYDKTWQSIAKTAVEKHAITKDGDGKITSTVEGYKELAAPLVGLDMSVAICGALPVITGGDNQVFEVDDGASAIQWFLDPTVAHWGSPVATDAEDGDIVCTWSIAAGPSPVAGQLDHPNSTQLGVWDITWTATDTDGNVATKVQRITIQDTTSPVLTIPGASTTVGGIAIYESIFYHDAWADPGYTVSDNADLDPAASLTTTTTFRHFVHDHVAADGSGTWTLAGSLDTSLINANVNSWTVATNYLYVQQVGGGGTLWKVTYAATDHSGNVTNVDRYIAVKADSIAPTFSVTSVDFPDVGPLQLTSAHDNSLYSIHMAERDTNGTLVTAQDTSTIAGPSVAVPVVMTIDFVPPAWVGGSPTAGLNNITTDRAGTYNITLTATDAAGNVSLLTKALTIVDTLGPALTLASGMTTVFLEASQPYTVNTGLTVLDISDGNSLNQNTNMIGVTLTNQAGVNTPIAGGPWDSSLPGQVTSMESAITAAVTTAAQSGEGEIIIGYTVTDSAGNVTLANKDIQIGCHQTIIQWTDGTLANYPLQELYYAVKADWLELDADGPVAQGVWLYNQTKFAAGATANEGLPMKYGPMAEAFVAGDVSFQPLCFITDPTDCTVVGLAKQDVAMPNQIIDYWPFDALWDGQVMHESDPLGANHQFPYPATTITAKTITSVALDIIVNNYNANNLTGTVICGAHWSTDPVVGGSLTGGNVANPAGIPCNPPCVAPLVCDPITGTCVVLGSPGDPGYGLSDKDLKINIALIPVPTLTSYHLIGLHTFEYDWAPIANDLFGLTGHIEEGFLAEQLEELFPAPDSSPPTSKEDGHIWWHEYMTEEQKSATSGVHDYYTFYNTELLDEKIAEAIS
jgi:hypothetical protein